MGIQEQTIERTASLDALRGLAVLLMLMQHIVYWLTSQPHNTVTIQAIGALGGLAAPIFVGLAGMGSTFLVHKTRKADILLLQRGLLIIGFGYLLNLLAPGWFTPQSWYVLHMIGFGILLSPILRRMSDHLLIICLFLVIFVTALAQNHLDTPLRLTNSLMAGSNLPGGTFRLILAESFFPIFPWTAFFISGLLAGRWLLCGPRSSLLRLAFVLLVSSIALSLLHFFGLSFTETGLGMRLSNPLPTFYPALAPASLCLMSLVLFFIAAFYAMDRFLSLEPNNILVCLGRSSLTIILVHIILIRESAVRFGFWQSFSLTEALLLTLGAVILFSLGTRLWYRADYRYGAEWLIRMITGSPLSLGRSRQ